MSESVRDEMPQSDYIAQVSKRGIRVGKDIGCYRLQVLNYIHRQRVVIRVGILAYAFLTYHAVVILRVHASGGCSLSGLTPSSQT